MKTSENTLSRPPRAPLGTRRERRLAPLWLCVPTLLAGCVPQIDLKRMTYEALRREDCRLNQLDEFCQRTFANEYAEYERLRRHFVRDAAERRLLPDAPEDVR